MSGSCSSRTRRPSPSCWRSASCRPVTRSRRPGRVKRAWEMARAAPPDLLPCDVMLPGIDGFEVVRVLRRELATANISIIMLTALVNVMEGLDAGADDYVLKPYDHRELLARVRSVLRDQSSPCSTPTWTTSRPTTTTTGSPAATTSCAWPRACSRPPSRPPASPPGRALRRRGRFALRPPGRAAGLRRGREPPGRLERFPIVTISVGVASTASRRFCHDAEAVAAATEMKSVAKQQQGSGWAVDRRSS